MIEAITLLMRMLINKARMARIMVIVAGEERMTYVSRSSSNTKYSFFIDISVAHLKCRD